MAPFNHKHSAPSPMHQAAATVNRTMESVPPVGLVMMSMFTIQLGAAIAKSLFPALGPGGTSLLRIGFAAIILMVAWRPKLTALRRRDMIAVALLGMTLGLMNFIFYHAINRIPLGVAVTIEFVGPLGVAVAGSRRWLDLAWVILAGAGVVLLSPWTGAALDPLGLGLALAAGSLWAMYILITPHVGRRFTGGNGLALAMSVAALIVLPFGIASAGTALLRPVLLLAGLGTALLSSVIPYSLEMEALRKLPTRLFGILMSLEPAIAGLVGWIVLRENLSIRALIAMGLVIAASIGATRWGTRS